MLFEQSSQVSVAGRLNRLIYGFLRLGRTAGEDVDARNEPGNELSDSDRISARDRARLTAARRGRGAAGRR